MRSRHTNRIASLPLMHRLSQTLMASLLCIAVLAFASDTSSAGPAERGASDAQATSNTDTPQRDSATQAQRRTEVGPSPRRVPPKRKGEISFDTILFEMDKEEPFEPSMITKEIRALEGKVVKIRGFILPASVFQQVGIKQFVLVRDNQECCFGPGAALYDCIMVKMAGDNSATFSTRPVAVKGKFRVTDEYRYPNGKYMAIYEMEATEVE
ncbi:MAG: DUF3299 domain-containing protein [Pirellulaceae bacterium]